MDHKDNNSLFSDNDLEIISSQSYIQRKNELIQSVYSTLLELEKHISSMEIQDGLPSIIKNKRGKISKGENYRGMPWVVLDAPALFENKSILAFRHIFIWGHPLSINLHVSGLFMEMLDYSKINHLDKTWNFLIGDNAFVNHFDSELYLPLSQFSTSIVNKLGYLRLTKTIPLEESKYFTNQCIHFIKNVSASGLITNQ